MHYIFNFLRINVEYRKYLLNDQVAVYKMSKKIDGIKESRVNAIQLTIENVNMHSAIFLPSNKCFESRLL